MRKKELAHRRVLANLYGLDMLTLRQVGLRRALELAQEATRRRGHKVG
jgi:hypothetical protein